MILSTRVEAGYLFGCSYNTLSRVFSNDGRACRIGCGSGVEFQYLLSVMLSKFSLVLPERRPAEERRESNVNPHQEAAVLSERHAL